MKVAVAGKSGSDKTVAAALLARALEVREPPVLAVDLDTNPGLAVTLGVDASDRPLPPGLVVEDDAAPYGWALAPELDAAAVVDAHARPAARDLRYLGAASRHRSGRSDRLSGTSAARSTMSAATCTRCARSSRASASRGRS